MKRPKYRNTKVELDGYTFDSKKEAGRYSDLKLLQRAGEINKLELQPEYKIMINGMLVCKIRPDFQYMDVQRGFVVEDVKSPITAKNPVYRLKKKLMKVVNGIEIQEV